MMSIITIIGLLAGLLTTWSLLPQVIRILKRKETKDLSSYTYEMLCAGIALWLVYGIMIKDLPIILANTVSLILASTVLVFKFRYG